MIPYAIFMMKFIWSDKTLEVRALDPVKNGVSFRLNKNWASPEEIECSFFMSKSREYKVLTLYDFVITPEEENLFILTSDQLDFQEALYYLVIDYTRYIRLKLSSDELSAMEEMTGHYLKESFPTSLADWHNAMRGLIPVNDCDFHLNKVELAICLDEPKMWDAFCLYTREDFIRFYWMENGLYNHPISKYEITHIYIGNHYCHHLFPDFAKLDRIVEITMKYGWEPVFVFSMMPEHCADLFETQLNWILQWEGPKEIVFNDLGTVLLLRKLLQKEAVEKNITLSLGILPMKRKKDFRLSWRKNSSIDFSANYECSVDSAVYRNYLKSLGVTQVSYEACGYPIKIVGEKNSLYLPLYQMNTSANCTLYALCKNGARGAQEEVMACPHYCEKRQCFYNEQLPMIGRYNSLFGCSMKELNDSEILNGYINAGIGRLVVRM